MNELLSYTPDYSTPLIDRMNRQSRNWYWKNREKALEYDTKRYRSRKFEVNPKWKKAFGGLT